MGRRISYDPKKKKQNTIIAYFYNNLKKTYKMKYPCENCSLRAKYDKNPNSFLGKLWRLHINVCPGFYGYYKSVDTQKKSELKKEYHLKRK